MPYIMSLDFVVGGVLVNNFTIRNISLIFWKYYFHGSAPGELGAEEGGQLGSCCKQ